MRWPMTRSIAPDADATNTAATLRASDMHAEAAELSRFA